MGNLNTSILVFKIKYRTSNSSVLLWGYICMNVNKHVELYTVDMGYFNGVSCNQEDGIDNIKFFLYMTLYYLAYLCIIF